SQYCRNYRHGRQIARQVPEDAHSGRSALSREILFRPRRPWISIVENAARQNRGLRLLGPMVSRSSAANGVARRRNHFLSDSNRLAPERKAAIWKSAAFGVGNDSTQSRHREWLLRRRGKSRGPRSARRWRWNRVLGTKFCLRARWRNRRQSF